MKIAIVTDSTSDLPADIAAERGIEIVPLHVLWGQENFTDGVDITPPVFYERLAHDPVLPKTSQPSPGEFAEKYKKAREAQSADVVLCITVSSKLSGTYSAAETARDHVDFPVQVIDSRSASMALGLVALAAADARDRGAGLDEIASATVEASKRVQFYFTLNTLEFLYRGGRIGGAQRFIGTALSIKPILTLKDGVVASAESVRTRKRAIARLAELACQQDQTRPLKVAVLDSGSPELRDFSNEMKTTLAPDVFMITSVSCTVGVYAGPAAIGFAMLAG
jgi:DegV family protein with EDD domain